MAASFDVIILVIAAVLVISGVMHGLIRSVCRFVALLCGFLVAWMYCRDLQAWLVSSTSSADGNSAFLTAFLIIFIVVSSVVLLLGHLLVKLLDKLELGWIDRLGGAALGLLKAGIIMWAACLSISSLPAKIFEEKFGTSVVFKAYEAMPKSFSLESMEGWRNSIRGGKGGAEPDNDGGSAKPDAVREDGIEPSDDFDSPLKRKLQKKSQQKTGGAADI